MANIFERIRGVYDGSANTTIAADNEDRPNVLSRYFGGHARKNHPHVSGYWQFIIEPPDKLLGDIKESSMYWFHSTAESFTPPTRTMNKGDIPGQGGLGSSYYTGQTLTRTFTVNFREFQNLPIHLLLQNWTSAIDPYTGVSPLKGSEWIPESYKGSALAVYTKPVQGSKDGVIDADAIDEVYYFHGVMPETPVDQNFNQDISTNDFTVHSVTFSFDGWPLTKKDDKVVERAVSMLSDFSYVKDTYNKYLEDVKV